MCFSEKISLGTFIIGIIGSFLCISLGTITDKIVGYVLGFAVMIQGLEYLIWRHQVCDEYNRGLSITGMWLNNLQPIIFGCIILLCNYKIAIFNELMVQIAIFIYALIAIPYSFEFLKSDVADQCTLKGEDTHLEWKWNNLPYGSSFVYNMYLLSISVMFIFGFPTKMQGMIAAFIAIISYIATYFMFSYKSLGTIWCFFAAFLPIIYYIGRIIGFIFINI